MTDIFELLLRLDPTYGQHWRGASSSEIDQIEILAEQELPQFHQRFLRLMGHSMGSLSTSDSDYSVSKILNYYEERLFEPASHLLFLGEQRDPDGSAVYLYFDLDKRVGDDAWVLSQSEHGGRLVTSFETFKEKLVWGCLLRLKIYTAPYRCFGVIKGENISSRLHLHLATEGFVQCVDHPIGTSGFYENSRSTFMYQISPSNKDHDYRYFDLCASNKLDLQEILDSMTRHAGVTVELLR